MRNILGNQKSETILSSKFKAGLGCNMSIKLHYIQNHFEGFPENLADTNEGHGEIFQQDSKRMLKKLPICFHLSSSTPIILELNFTTPGTKTIVEL